MNDLKRSSERIEGVISATRGNHGQSVARAAQAAGFACTLLVPHGNSREKNAAMRAFGAELIEHGQDFDEAREEADRIAVSRGLHYVPSFHPALIKGVATYALELFRAVHDLDTVYVPIGMGSGICGVMAARDLLGLRTRIVGVVAEAAPCMALSLEAGRPISTNSASTFADGLACRVPNPDAVEAIARGASRIIQVGEEAIAEAIRIYYEDTHNLAEGAGAAALAALIKDRPQADERVAVILSGGNIDRELFAQVLGGGTPRV
jgi:threonine dehydratase